jgi:hypothetical protein
VVVGLVVGAALCGVVVSVSRASVPVNIGVEVVGGCGCGLWSCEVVCDVGSVGGSVVGLLDVGEGGGDVVGGVHVVVGVRWGGGGVGLVVWMGVANMGLECGCGSGVVGGVVCVGLGFRLPSVFLNALILAFCPARCYFRTVTQSYLGL